MVYHIYKSNIMKSSINKIKLSILLAILCVTMSNSLLSQNSTFRKESWRYGANLGLQLNSVGLGWQELHGSNPNFQSPKDDIDYVDGSGVGVYAGFFGEYLSESWWGVQFRISYDSRNSLIIDNTRNPIPSFDSKMSYLVFEPLFRIDQALIPNLNFYVGPFLGVNLNGSYIYKPDKDQSSAESEVDVVGLNSMVYGLQGGMAYDIMLQNLTKRTSLFLSPFVDCSWMVNQKESQLELNQNAISDIWSTVSVRAGVRISFDYSEAQLGTQNISTSAAAIPLTNKVKVIAPEDNIILTKNIKGYFPIHPFVFFDKGSKDIPVRYTLLSKAEAQNFKEEDLGDFMKGNLTVKETNVDQLMKTYYNNMNIFADRMKKNPSEKLTLIGSDPAELNGANYANTVKDYLVNTFGIDKDRIDIKVAPPRKPSGSSVTDSVFINKINDENRKVDFYFTNPDMLKALTYTIRDESSIDNDMIFKLDSNAQFRSWDITITGENQTMYFGPFASRNERINPAELMRFLESGTYNAKVEITDRAGKKSEENITFKLFKEKSIRNASRYLMIFEYNKSDAVKTYEDKIVKEIVPGIIPGNKVIIHGHTDNIGNPEDNLTLSQARANEAQTIIDRELKKNNKNVNTKAYGLGQDKTAYTFDNKYPEGRMYNRNIFVEIIE